ncbi:hypothetical protein QE369_004225 [Agrobacterium larrymoorei]|uniref:Uncharacterized protein n=1 Tax=Agrobacterium larrymoorei TaxID=160699 RepID=A0AAJ2BHS9_9HYPH|nr:hypothetical protein [Agrobacterium larrymoorei]
MSVKDLTQVFPSSVELFTLRKLKASKGLPEGWRLTLPIGRQNVSLELFSIRHGELGAYRIRASHTRRPKDEWEARAIDILGDLAAFVVIEISDIFESRAGNIVAMAHRTWTTGNIDALIPHLRASYRTTEDQTGLRWVTVKGELKGRRKA